MYPYMYIQVYTNLGVCQPAYTSAMPGRPWCYPGSHGRYSDQHPEEPSYAHVPDLTESVGKNTTKRYVFFPDGL